MHPPTYNLGFHLFTQEPWRDVIDDPRMLTVQIQAYATDDSGGRMTATVQPSGLFKNSVFVATNDHYTVEPDVADASDAMALLRSVFDESVEHSASVIERARRL
jgi:hypothetical protein